jgi:hypothetical protein
VINAPRSAFGIAADRALRTVAVRRPSPPGRADDGCSISRSSSTARGPPPAAPPPGPRCNGRRHLPRTAHAYRWGLSRRPVVHVCGDAATASLLTGAHRPDLALRWVQLLQRTAPDQVRTVPHGPERDIGLAKSSVIQRVHTLGRRGRVHVSEVFGDQTPNLLMAEVVEFDPQHTDFPTRSRLQYRASSNDRPRDHCNSSIDVARRRPANTVHCLPRRAAMSNCRRTPPSKKSGPDPGRRQHPDEAVVRRAGSIDRHAAGPSVMAARAGRCPVGASMACGRAARRGMRCQPPHSSTVCATGNHPLLVSLGHSLTVDQGVFAAC